MIQKIGKIDEEEMRHVFNLGIGMILIAREENVDTILDMTKHESSQIIGRIK